MLLSSLVCRFFSRLILAGMSRKPLFFFRDFGRIRERPVRFYFIVFAEKPLKKKKKRRRLSLSRASTPVFVHGVARRDGVCHTPLGQFSKLDCSTTKRVPILNDTYVFGKLSARIFPTPTVLAPTLIRLWRDIEHGKYRPRGV